MSDRPQTLGEEIANSVSHGAGFLASVAALPLLVIAGARHHNAWQVVAGAIYASTLVLLYGASTLYHAVPARSHAKPVLRVVDHGAIYLLIAGTYTPFALGALRGPWGWSLLGTIWTLALAGIVLKAGVGFKYPRLSTAVYLLMGWLVVVAIHPLAVAVGPAGLAWLLAGGAFYTLGVLFYTRPRMRYAHLVWHLFVLGGSACHLVAVAGYANGIPR
ncbi:MAG: PAQR family membrane homeostasis protein TrhA [Gemmatimonadaceae bacterium]|nr:hemolysin III family protein [Gemmatimonadaceae bacterium]